MFVLLLKNEKPGFTETIFVGVYTSKEDAEKHVDKRFGPLEERGHGNARMLEACDSTPPKAVWSTQVFHKLQNTNESYVLAQY